MTRIVSQLGNGIQQVGSNMQTTVDITSKVVSEVDGLSAVFKFATAGFELSAAAWAPLSEGAKTLGDMMKTCSSIMSPFQCVNTVKDWVTVRERFKKEGVIGIAKLICLTILTVIGVSKFLEKLKILNYSAAVARIGANPVIAAINSTPILGLIVQYPLAILGLTVSLITLGVQSSKWSVVSATARFNELQYKKNQIKADAFRLRNNTPEIEREKEYLNCVARITQLRQVLGLQRTGFDPDAAWARFLKRARAEPQDAPQTTTNLERAAEHDRKSAADNRDAAPASAVAGLGAPAAPAAPARRSLADRIQQRIKLWGVNKDNAIVDKRKTWLSIACEVVKIAAIVLGFILALTSITFLLVAFVAASFAIAKKYYDKAHDKPYTLSPLVRA